MNKPLKPKNIVSCRPIGKYYGRCQGCNNMVFVIDKYCSGCGKKLDWNTNDIVNHCADCKWFKKLKCEDREITVCWFPFKNGNEYETISEAKAENDACLDFEAKDG